MGKVGWAISALIIAMVIGLLMVSEAAENLDAPTGCEYEYKYKNNKRVKVLDCD